MLTSSCLHFTLITIILNTGGFAADGTTVSTFGYMEDRSGKMSYCSDETWPRPQRGLREAARDVAESS
jgi:hypothetical protein